MNVTLEEKQAIEDAAVTYLELRTPDALEKVVEVSEGYVQSIIRTHVVPSAEASSLVSHEDLFQEGMMGLLAALKNYDPANGKFRSWAWYRVRGAALDYIRRISPTVCNRNMQFISIDEHEIELADPAAVVMDGLPRESTLALGQAISEMPTRQQIVVLFLLNGVSVECMTGVLGMSVGNLLSLQRQSLDYLSHRLTELLPHTVLEIGEGVSYAY